MLASAYQTEFLEAGCDEAGRGCLAGPVFAAAVILLGDNSIPGLNDSKKLSEAKRLELRDEIEQKAFAYAIAFVDHTKIDEINILNASILAMHKALDGLKNKPGFIIVDGNKFKPYRSIPHETIVKGDGKYQSIAAASIPCQVLSRRIHGRPAQPAPTVRLESEQRVSHQQTPGSHH